MSRGFWRSSPVLAADGATTQGSNVGLPEGILHQMTVAVDNDSGPVLVVVNMLPEGTDLPGLPLFATWTRSGVSGSGSRGGEPWKGDYPLSQDAIAQIFVRNDTGSEARVVVYFAGVRV